MKRIATPLARSGAALVEFAVISPVVFLVLFGTLEWCRYLMMQNVAENAVREGARYAVCRTNIDQTQITDANIRATVTTYLANAGGQINNLQIYVYKVNTAGQPIDLNGNVITQAQAIAASNQQNWYQSAFGQGICVQITGSYTPMIASFLRESPTIPIQVTTVMYSEGN